MNVHMGPASWVGFIGAAAAAIAPLVGELASSAEPLGVPPTVWVTISAVLASVTVIGRMAQAIAVVRADSILTHDVVHTLEVGDAGDEELFPPEER